MTIYSASLKLGVASGLGSAMLQAAAPSSTSVFSPAILVPIISAALGGLVSYAMLKTTVQKMEEDVRTMRHDMGDLSALLRDSMTKIAHIEGRLTTHHHKEP